MRPSVICDQITKALVRASRCRYSKRTTVIPGCVDFVHVQNAGVAFGLLNDLRMHAVKAVVTTALALAGARRASASTRGTCASTSGWRASGLSLILGGAVGNLIDRVRQGYVLDFVDVYWRGWHFWAFNVADASITIGAVLVFLDLLLVTRHASHPV